jgi:multidrug efflux system membrane fusion protein
MKHHSHYLWPAAVAAGILGLAFCMFAAEFAFAASGSMRVTVAVKAQRASGITVTRLKTAQYRPQVTGYGRVMDLTPLLTLRAQLQAAEAALSAAQQEYLRLEGLNRHGQNISAKRLQAAHAVWQSARAQVAMLRARALQHWGSTLTRWLESHGNPRLDGLADGRRQLLRISAAQASYRVMPPSYLEIGGGARATLVSASPRINPEIQAPTYFYLAESAMPVGFQFTAGFPISEKVFTGVRIPEAAVIWYAGAAWVYVRISATEFERRLITTQYPDAGGWFVSAGVHPGEELVIQGAELLFADEFASHSQGGGGSGDD